MNIFIDTEDMEERYGEQLYQDYLVEQNKYLQQIIDKAIEHNNQIIKDTKGFYIPTSDTIYSGDTLINIAEQNLKILKGDNNE